MQAIRLYGPGTDSGTFDYFTETINGAAGASRPDYTANEDDNALVRGISGDEYALGYFGYAYYAANRDTLKLIPIDGGNGHGAVIPTEETINNGSYAPLSRPIFIYARKAALQRPEVRALVDFYIDNAALLAAEVGYIALPDEVYRRLKERIAHGESGTAYSNGEMMQSRNLFDPD
jgi:phosphate transport system substrate-binding protein